MIAARLAILKVERALAARVLALQARAEAGDEAAWPELYAATRALAACAGVAAENPGHDAHEQGALRTVRDHAAHAAAPAGPRRAPACADGRPRPFAPLAGGGRAMTAAGIRDVRRGPDPGAVELTLTDGSVLHVVASGWHQQEQERVQAAVLAALAASGVPVVAG